MQISKTFKKLSINSLLIIPSAIFITSVIGANSYLNNQRPMKEKLFIQTPTEFVFEEKSLEEKQKLCSKTPDCMLLVEAGYFESRGEVDMGVIGIMQVILNRVESDHPIFTNQTSIKDVIYKPAQFSYTHEEYLKIGMLDTAQVKRLKVVAWDVYNKEYEDLTHGSLYYHEISYSPHWSKVYEYQLTIDRHAFYSH